MEPRGASDEGVVSCAERCGWDEAPPPPCARAGTYIKEFVHGDFGRTRPSVGELLGCKADIMQLDVTEIDMTFGGEDDDGGGDGGGDGGRGGGGERGEKAAKTG